MAKGGDMSSNAEMIEVVCPRCGEEFGHWYRLDDPAAMAAQMLKVEKPCIGFKIMAASRNCGTPEDVRNAFSFAYKNIKPTDIVDVGMFQRDKNQVAENAGFVREILGQLIG